MNPAARTRLAASRRSAFFAILAKEAIHIRRDPQTLVLAFLMPLLMLLIYGHAIRLEPEHLPLAVRDADHSGTGRRLLERLEANPTFEIAARIPVVARAIEPLERGTAKATIVLERGFGRGRGGLGLLIDGSEPTAGALGDVYLGKLMARATRGLIPGSPGAAGGSGVSPIQAAAGPGAGTMPAAASPAEPAARVRTRIWYNPDLESSDFVVPGLVGIVMMMLCALLTSITISRERETGTFEQVFVSPVTRLEIVAGKVLAYVVLGFTVAAAVIGFGWLAFGVPIRGPLVQLGLVTLVYAATALGIGVFISTLVATQRAAMIGALFATVLPSVILSGFIFPVESMPLPLQVLCWFVPARHYVVVIRGMLLRGVGLEYLWPHAIYLLVLGVAFTALSAARFRTRLE